jgi:hypothetical protein
MHFAIRKATWHQLLWVSLVFPLAAQGATVKVACGQKVTFPTITSALKALASVSSGANTVIVSGACHENVAIQGFGRLTLRAGPGASINDASGGTAPVIYVDGSTEVTFKGFTINGGSTGVLCGNFSVCRFDGNTIQGAVAAGIQAYESRVSLDANTIQNNGTGLVLLESSDGRSNGGLVIQQNLGSGVDLDTGGSLAAFGTTIRDNGSNGIEANNHCSLLVMSTSITGNAGNGVFITGQSSADFEGDDLITGNGASGVWVRDLSFVEFRTPSVVTGNG